jgi:hypothetical protein
MNVAEQLRMMAVESRAQADSYDRDADELRARADRASAKARELHRDADAYDTAANVLDPTPVGVVDSPVVDRRPHSRACPMLDHIHGSACSPDCPTCNPLA